MVTVELAHGSTSLFRKAGCSKLLFKEDVEPIIPVRQLIEAGYQLKWNSSEVSIWHPKKGYAGDRAVGLDLLQSWSGCSRKEQEEEKRNGKEHEGT